MSSAAIFASGVFILYIIFESLYYACFIEEMLSLATTIRVGARDVVSLTRDRYIERLTWIKTALRITNVVKKSEHRKTAYARVAKVLEELKLDRADGSLRKQPYCIVLCGPPGAGKTGTAMKIASALIKAKYGKFYQTDVVTLNETDKFQSEYRTYHKVVIFDDMAATKLELETQGNPFRPIIDYVNNIRKTSLNPNVEMKGTVYIEPEVVIITTNMVEFNPLSQWNNCPGALIRRFSKILYLLPDHKSCRVLNEGKESRSNSSLAFHNGSGFDNTLFSIGDFKTKPTTKIDDVIPDIVTDFQVFSDAQERHVNNVNSAFDKVEANENPFICFYHDLCRTFNFIVPALPPEMESLLPWYTKIWRRCCLKKECFLAQGGFETHKPIESLYQLTLDNPDYRFHVLKQTLNIQHLIVLYPLLKEFQWCDSLPIYITDTGFWSNHHHFTYPGFPLEPREVYHHNSVGFTLGELEDYMDYWFKEVQLPETRDSLVYSSSVDESNHSDIPEDISYPKPVDNPLDLFHSIQPKPIGRERTAQNLAISLFSDNYDLIGQEVLFVLSGKKVSCDLIFKHKSNDSYAFVEAKSKGVKRPKRQILERKYILLPYKNERIVWEFYYFTLSSGKFFQV